MNFKHMHPAAIGGFIANLAITAVLQQSMQHPEGLAALPPGMGPEQFALVLKLLWWTIAFQGLGLVLILLKSPVGVIVGIISGILMLPLAYIYIAGCLLSQSGWRYAPFAEAAKDEGRPLAAFPFYQVQGLSTSVIALSVVGALVFFFMNAMLGTLLIASATFCLYIVSRIKNRPVLALYDGFFTYTGGFFAKSIKVPYPAVRSGSLAGEDAAKLEVAAGEEATSLLVSVKGVRADMRRQALDGLGRMLVHYSVPLG